MRFESLNFCNKPWLWAAVCLLWLAGGVQASEAPRTVRLETVDAAPARSIRRFVGRVEAVHTVNMAFRVGGRIDRMTVREGDVVSEGELIAEMDRRDYELALEEAEVALEQARLDHRRNRELLERDVIPQSTFDRSRTELRTREVAVDRARRNLSHTRLEAPFDALVTRRLVDPFTLVQAGTQVIRLQDVGEWRIVVSIPEDLMTLLDDREQLQAAVTLSAWPEREFSLAYREHATEPDPVTQTYAVRFGMPRPDDVRLLPGMTGTVGIGLRQGGEGSRIDVPVSALDTGENGNFRVWIHDMETGEVSPREVETGSISDDRIVITDGLEGGEQIVTAGAHLLHDGMRVTPFRSR